MASIGDAFIDVHANTAPFDRELTGDLERVAKDSEGELGRTGKGIGDKVSDGMDSTLKRRGKGFAKSIEEGTRRTVIQVRSLIRFDKIRETIRRRFRKDVGDSIASEIGDALERSTQRGGILSKFGQGIADAIGSGFNVSGRSPLIAVLLPAILALVGVITAAVQAANALVAVLFIIPALLSSIALQAGVVFIAFQGIGKAVQGAFAAKNAKELREALKGLTPSAKSFVRELLPLRGLFKDIGRTVQERFFNQLAGVVTNLRKTLGPLLSKGFGNIAASAGKFFRAFGELLASPVFVNFFKRLVPATVRWVDKLGGSLFGKRGFITGLLAMSTRLIPFMEKFGDIVLRALDQLAGLMFQLTSRPDTQQWLDDMAATLQLVIDLAFNLGDFLFVLLKQLNAAGGAALITTLSKALMELSFFFASPAGKKALEGLIDLGIFGIQALTGLIVVIGLVLAAFEVLGEWLRVTGIPAFMDFFRAVVQGSINAATWLSVWIDRIVGWISRFFDMVGGWILGAVNAVKRWASEVGKAIASFMVKMSEIPGRIRKFFDNFGGLLVNSGKALINGLINGIKQKLQELWNLLGSIAGRIGGFFGLSPAKEGPLSGRGYIKFRGQHLMQDLLKGIQSETPALRDTMTNATSNIVFGTNSIQMQFHGPVPDQQQARTVGSALGMRAADVIATRNTRLAVRTM